MTLADRYRMWRKNQRVKRGLCRQCGTKRKTASALCERCLTEKAARMRKYRLSAVYPLADAQRLREFAEWEARNPPESGVVKVTRDPHGAFWRWVETRRCVG